MVKLRKPVFIENHSRSLIKAISWRITGTVDTFIISWLITGRVKIATGIAFTEIFTKIVLFGYMKDFGIKLIGEDYINISSFVSELILRKKSEI